MLGLNAPYGAPCFLTFAHVAVPLGRRGGLNAPYGAPCFPTDDLVNPHHAADPRLNAPYGAPCFLTQTCSSERLALASLNAPYGAPCFLTREYGKRQEGAQWSVLMHLMALRAF